MRPLDRNAIRFDAAGLVPAVVQDDHSGRVLMLGYMNIAALEATERTGQVHFWSRSREELWRKGATSGNTLRCIGLALDCDGDALLVTAEARGPTCHTGEVSCFGNDGRPVGSLATLWQTIAERKAARPDGSYTVTLLDQGVDGCARKVLEEAGETAFAAKDHAVELGSSTRVVEESADLVYHLLVLLAERGIELDRVMEELRRRAR